MGASGAEIAALSDLPHEAAAATAAFLRDDVPTLSERTIAAELRVGEESASSAFADGDVDGSTDVAYGLLSISRMSAAVCSRDDVPRNRSTTAEQYSSAGLYAGVEMSAAAGLHTPVGASGAEIAALRDNSHLSAARVSRDDDPNGVITDEHRSGGGFPSAIELCRRGDSSLLRH